MNETTSGPVVLVEQQWKSMRALLHSLAIAVLILTGTVFVYIYRQVVITRRNTAEMVRYLAQYERSETDEMIERVRLRLDAYRQENPEFNPIYLKYFGTNNPPAAAVTTSPAETNVNAKPPAR
jgi:hypothetical protein